MFSPQTIFLFFILVTDRHLATGVLLTLKYKLRIDEMLDDLVFNNEIFKSELVLQRDALKAMQDSVDYKFARYSTVCEGSGRTLWCWDGIFSMNEELSEIVRKIYDYQSSINDCFTQQVAELTRRLN